MAAEPRKLKSRRGQLAAPPRIYALSTTPNMAVGLDDSARIRGIGLLVGPEAEKSSAMGGEGERIRRSLKKPLQNSAPLLKQAAKIGQLQTRPFSGLQLHTDFIFSGDCGNPGLGNCSLHEFLEILESARPNLPPAGPIPAASSSRWGPGRLAAAFVVVSAPLEKGRALESPLGALRKGNTDCAEQYSYTVMLSQ